MAISSTNPRQGRRTRKRSCESCRSLRIDRKPHHRCMKPQIVMVIFYHFSEFHLPVKAKQEASLVLTNTNQNYKVCSLVSILLIVHAIEQFFNSCHRIILTLRSTTNLSELLCVGHSIIALKWVSSPM